MTNLATLTLVLFVTAYEVPVSANNMSSLPETIRAVGFYKYLPISDPESLLDLEVKLPSYGDQDLLIEVKAASVNPVDVKLRAPKPDVETTPKILGYEGSGIVVAKGEKANLFNVGDEVFFSGDITRPGSNSQYLGIDQYHVGNKPKKLSYPEAAVIPATGLVAYEAIFDRMLLSEKDKGKTLLIINSAGGVGAIATQLAKVLGLTVIGTASRPESKAFTLQNGADLVLNHRNDLAAQLKEKGYESGVDFILVLYDPAPYWDTLGEIIKPEGKICMIVDSSKPVDLKQMNFKSVTLSFEFVATRSIFNLPTRTRQHDILQELSKLVDEGKLKSTLTKTLTPLNAANLKEAHRLIEEGKMIGKVVLLNV